MANRLSVAQIGVAGGVASLDGSGKVPSSQLPSGGTGGGMSMTVIDYDAADPANYISEWKVPEDTSDGTYLKINGQCTLFGKSMKTGDLLQLYNNSQDGILIKQ